jgi:hypothetical protein
LIAAIADCAALTSITGAGSTGDLRQVDLAGFRPRPRFRVESSYGYERFLRFEFSFELGFGNGEIDHKAESIRDLPSR